MKSIVKVASFVALNLSNESTGGESYNLLQMVHTRVEILEQRWKWKNESDSQFYYMEQVL